MQMASRMQEVRRWRQETLQEIERTASQVEKLHRQIEKARERVSLLDQLLSLESGAVEVSLADDLRPTQAGTQDT